jgi:hypothetical protein
VIRSACERHRAILGTMTYNPRSQTNRQMQQAPGQTHSSSDRPPWFQRLKCRAAIKGTISQLGVGVLRREDPPPNKASLLSKVISGPSSFLKTPKPLLKTFTTEERSDF